MLIFSDVRILPHLKKVRIKYCLFSSHHGKNGTFFAETTTFANALKPTKTSFKLFFLAYVKKKQYFCIANEKRHEKATVFHRMSVDPFRDRHGS